jgi:hypothetical protein
VRYRKVFVCKRKQTTCPHASFFCLLFFSLSFISQHFRIVPPTYLPLITLPLSIYLCRSSTCRSPSSSLFSDDEDVKKTWQTGGGSAQKRSNNSGKAKGTSGVGVRSSAKKRKKKSKDAKLFLEDLDDSIVKCLATL